MHLDGRVSFQSPSGRVRVLEIIGPGMSLSPTLVQALLEGLLNGGAESSLAFSEGSLSPMCPADPRATS